MRTTPLEVTVQLAKALAHPTRLRILALLRQGPLPVCQIASVLHSVASTVSGHLLELRRSGLAIEQRQGKFVYYHLAGNAATLAVVDTVCASFDADPRVRADAALAVTVRAVSPLIACHHSVEPEDGRAAALGSEPASRAGGRQS